MEPIAMSSVFYDNIINILVKENEKYKEWIKYSYTKKCYHCNIIKTDFNDWIENDMKG